MDAISLFAIVVFSTAWFLLHRTPADEPLARLFFGTLMFCAAGAGVLGLVMRMMPR